MGNKLTRKKSGDSKSASKTSSSSPAPVHKTSSQTKVSRKASEPKVETKPKRRVATKTESGPSTRKIGELFAQYAGEADVMQSDGLVQLCDDLGVEPEDVKILVLTYHLGAAKPCEYQREEFVTGLVKLKCDSLEKLRQRMDAFPGELKKEDRMKEVFEWAFHWSKEMPDSRNIDLESASFLVEILLADAEKYPLAGQFPAFLEEQSSYKAVNKDQWYNLLDFCSTTAADLSNYDETSSWPVLLDEYVEWLRAKDPVRYPMPERDVDAY